MGLPKIALAEFRNNAGIIGATILEQQEFAELLYCLKVDINAKKQYNNQYHSH